MWVRSPSEPWSCELSDWHAVVPFHILLRCFKRALKGPEWGPVRREGASVGDS